MEKIMNLRWFRLFLLVGLLSCLFIAGCSDDEGEGGGEEDLNPIELVQEGWNEFEDLNFETAMGLFDQARSIDPTYADAFSGAGWSRYQMGDNPGAVEVWELGLEGTSGSTLDLTAGLGFAAFDDDDYTECISRFEEVIEFNPSYAFDHYGGIDVLDLHWTIAECNYLQGDFDLALERVLILNPNFIIDLTDGDGEFIEEAIYALAEEIERLEEIVRG